MVIRLVFLGEIFLGNSIGFPIEHIMHEKFSYLIGSFDCF
jgi:hypothetical protein